MLNVHRLRLLLELRNRGTIARVAEALSYSPSAVSQQLTQLEAEARTPLLESAGRGVRLTAQGQLLCSHAERILTALEAAEADLAASAAGVRGTLTVGFFQTVSLVLAPLVLREMAELYPELTVEMREVPSDRALSALDARTVDLVAGEELPGLPMPNHRPYHRHDFATESLHVVVPADWGTSPRLHDLADRPWVLEPSDIDPGSYAERLCRDAGFEPLVRYRSQDLIVQLNLVASGLAAAILPATALIALPRTGIAESTLPAEQRRRLFTIVRAGAETRPDVVAFRAALGRCTAAVARENPNTFEPPPRDGIPHDS